MAVDRWFEGLRNATNSRYQRECRRLDQKLDGGVMGQGEGQGFKLRMHTHCCKSGSKFLPLHTVGGSTD